MYYFYTPGPREKSEAGKYKGELRGGQGGNRLAEHIRDSYSSLGAVSQAMLRAGLVRARLVVGIDLTASNEWQGRTTFHCHSLHRLHPVRPGSVYNPYQKVINIIGKTLQPFTELNTIFAYGFGDRDTQDRTVFNISLEEGRPCKDFREVLDLYNSMVRKVVLSGPTSFAPIIRKAMNHVVESNNIFHILVIIADGQMEDEAATVSAIVEASKLPLSIVLVGVGDGPWDVMEQFDDHIIGREFDNFQFVDFHSIRESRNPEAGFALAALMEIPLQYEAMLQLGYFEDVLS